MSQQGVIQPKLDPNHPATVALGFVKRVVNPLPEEMSIALIDELKVFVEDFVKRHFLPLAPESDTSRGHWLDNSSYPAWRREELAALCEQAVANWKDHITCKSFIKDESYAELKHARTINPRDDYFKCFSGPIFSLIEKEVFKNPVFIKKVPIADRAKYIMDNVYAPGANYICTDYTSFESSFTAEAMNACEMVLYKHMSSALPNGTEWFEAIKTTLTGPQRLINRWVTVRTTAGRCSGDMCTSLGNGFTNWMLMLFASHKMNLGSLHGVFEGDDGLCRFSSGKAPSSDFFRRLGFVVKMEVVPDLSSASFCGMLFDPESCQQIGDPRNFFANFGWTSSKYAGAKRSKLVSLARSKALSAAHMWNGCPLISKFAFRVLELTKGFDIAWVRNSRNTTWWERERLNSIKDLALTEAMPTWQTRLLFERKYGISPECQIRFEEKIALLEFGSFDFGLDFPAIWTKMYDHYVVPIQIEPSNPFHPARTYERPPSQLPCIDSK